MRHLLTTIPLFSAIAAALVLSSAGRAAADVVYLTTGAQVHGTVMTQDPVDGVEVRLADGTTRTLPASQVEYVGRANTGGLQIDGEEPAKVTLQGEVHGRTPFYLGNLWPSTYRIKLEFDGGGSVETDVVVRTGLVERVKLSLPEWRRPGARSHAWQIGAAPSFGVAEEEIGLGLSVQGGPEFTVSQAVAFQFLGTLGFVVFDGDDLSPQFGLLGAFRFLLSTWYSMELGLKMGGLPVYRGYAYPGPELEGAVGVHASLLSLRFGTVRRFDLSLWHTVSYLIDLEQGHFETGLALRYTFGR